MSWSWRRDLGAMASHCYHERRDANQGNVATQNVEILLSKNIYTIKCMSGHVTYSIQSRVSPDPGRHGIAQSFSERRAIYM